MEIFNVQLVLVRSNKLCVAIKQKLKATNGIKLQYDQDIWKQKNLEMKYNIKMDNSIFQIEEFSGCIRPAQVINPLIEVIKEVLSENKVTNVTHEWGAHVPTIGMLPIAYLFWLDAGATVYIKK